MVSKLISYILAGIGIALIALMSVIQGLIQSVIPTFPTSPPYILLAGVAFVLLGVVLLMSDKKNKQEKEVPIYDKSGKNIVGYRRMK